MCSVSSREEAEAFIAEIRAEHRDATHNVPVMIIGEQSQLQWASDDGEPQGTSGAPVLQLLNGQELTNVALVVTRYYGGIKLGPGGLMRAYTGTARLALEEAGIVQVREEECFRAVFGYSHLDKLQHLAAQGRFGLSELVYGEQVEGTFSVPPEEGPQLMELLGRMTGGTAKILERKIREM